MRVKSERFRLSTCFRKVPIVAFCVIGSLALSACLTEDPAANPSPTETPTTPSPTTSKDLEFQKSYAPGAVNADRAFEMGVTGEGVTVAIIDTGANVYHDQLTDAVDDSTISVVTNTSNVADSSGHGTGVAGVIGAAQDDIGMVGIAYNADLMIVKADEPDGRFNPYRLRQAIEYATRANADIINLSIAGDSAPPFSFIQAMQGAVDAGVLMVIAAGNAGLDNPQYPAAYAGVFDGPGQVIAVGAVDKNNVIADFSNRAGDAKDFFLVAPGAAITTLDQNGGTKAEWGTSFAAPVVSGAAALVKEHSPHLNGSQIADLLLQTAKDLGATGVDEIYGHGLLDIAKALEPFGVTILPAGVRTDEAANDFNTASATVLHFDPAFAQALQKNEALKNVMAYDMYERGYKVDLNDAVQVQSTGVDMANWLDIAAVDSTETLQISQGMTLSYGATPSKWVDAGQVDTQGTFFHFTSDVSTHSEVQASVGLPLSTHMGLAAMGAESGSIHARHAMENPFLSFAGSDLGMSYNRKFNQRFSVRAAYGANTNMLSGQPSGQQNTNLTALKSSTNQTVTAAEATLQVSPKLRVAGNLGRLTEHGSLLNSYGSGAFGFQGRALTNFASFSARYQPVRNLNLYASYTRGATQDSRQKVGFIREVNNVQSDAFSLGISKSQTRIARMAKDATDKVTLSVSQPLRVRSGQVLLDVSGERDADGNITRVQENVNLGASGRQIDTELNYALSLKGRGRTTNTVAVRAGVTRQANHDVNADIQSYFGIKLRREF